MAVNWTTAQAVVVIREGTDKAAIQDIARRFPLFAVAAASGSEGLVELLQATPEHLTTRKIEAKLKEGLDGAEVAEPEVEAVEEKPAKKEKPAKGKGKGKAKVEVEVEEEEEDEEEAPAPKAKKGKGKKKKEVEPEPEEEDDDWDEEDEDEEEDGDGLDDMSLAELKKEAKKRKVDIKGLKKPAQIIEALRADGDDEEEDDDDEDEDWDL